MKKAIVLALLAGLTTCELEPANAQYSTRGFPQYGDPRSYSPRNPGVGVVRPFNQARPYPHAGGGNYGGYYGGYQFPYGGNYRPYYAPYSYGGGGFYGGYPQGSWSW